MAVLVAEAPDAAWALTAAALIATAPRKLAAEPQRQQQPEEEEEEEENPNGGLITLSRSSKDRNLLLEGLKGVRSDRQPLLSGVYDSLHQDRVLHFSEVSRRSRRLEKKRRDEGPRRRPDQKQKGRQEEASGRGKKGIP